MVLVKLKIPTASTSGLDKVQKLWPLKLHYFLQGAGAAPVIPYLPVIGKQMGITGSGIGFILALAQVFGLVIKPTLGTLMDKYPGAKLKMLQFLILLGLCSMNLLKLMPPIENVSDKSLNVTHCFPDQIKALLYQSVPDPCLKHKLHDIYDLPEKCVLKCVQAGDFQGLFYGASVQLEKNHHLSFILDDVKPEPNKQCILADKCSISCSIEELDRVFNAGQESENIAADPRFWLILIFWVFGASCFNGVATFQDAITVQCLQNSHETFGHQRLWASVGWGSSALVIGYVLDSISADKLLYDYSLAFNVLTILLLLDLFVVAKLPVIGCGHVQSANQNPIKDIASIIGRIEVQIFLIYSTTVGICFGALTQQFILLEELGHRSDCNGVQAMKFLQGLVLAINCLAETPMFLYSAKIIKKFGSVKVMNGILFLFSLRLMFYGQLISPWQVILFEWVHGPIVGLFYPIMTSTAFQISPDNLTTTTTAVAYFMEGLGIAIGSWIAGTLVQFIGASSTFTLLGFFASFMFILHYLVQNLMSNQLVRS